MEWLPDAAEREMRCASYRSPLKASLLQYTVNTVRRKGRRYALIRGQRGEASHGASRNQSEREFTHAHSDPEVSSSELHVSSPHSNQTRDLSEFESSLAFHDAVEQISVEDTTSWLSAQSRSDPVCHEEESISEMMMPKATSSRRRLLHSCGFPQQDQSSCSQDEVIWRPAISNASPPVHASADSEMRTTVEGKNWMCCRFRSRHPRDEPGCRCICLYASKAA